MSTEDNKELCDRLWECWNQGNVALLDEVLAPDFILHDPSSPIPAGIHSREDYKQYLLSFRVGFQGQFANDDVIAEGEKVVVRYTFRGTHQGQWRGVPSSNKAMTFTGTVTYRIVDGKIVEGWQNVDSLGVMRQLGLIPT